MEFCSAEMGQTSLKALAINSCWCGLNLQSDSRSVPISPTGYAPSCLLFTADVLSKYHHKLNPSLIQHRYTMKDQNWGQGEAPITGKVGKLKVCSQSNRRGNLQPHSSEEKAMKIWLKLGIPPLRLPSLLSCGFTYCYKCPTSCTIALLWTSRGFYLYFEHVVLFFIFSLHYLL